MYIQKLTQHSVTRKSWSLLSFALDCRVGILSTSTSQCIQQKIPLSNGQYRLSSCRTELFLWALGEWSNLHTPPWISSMCGSAGQWSYVTPSQYQGLTIFLAYAWGVQDPLDGSIPLSISWPACLLWTWVCSRRMEGATYRKDPLRNNMCMKWGNSSNMTFWACFTVSHSIFLCDSTFLARSKDSSSLGCNWSSLLEEVTWEAWVPLPYCLLLDKQPTWVKQDHYSPQMSHAETSAPVGVPVAEWEECCRDWWYCQWEQQSNAELGGADEQSWVSIHQRSSGNTPALAFGVIYIFVIQIHI